MGHKTRPKDLSTQMNPQQLNRGRGGFCMWAILPGKASGRENGQPANCKAQNTRHIPWRKHHPPSGSTFPSSRPLRIARYQMIDTHR